MAIGAEHHPARNYDISLNDYVGDKFMFAMVDDSITYHLSVLRNLLAQTSYRLDF